MDKKRVYYFDNKNILDHNSSHINERKFDQNYDELQASDVFKRSNLSQKGNAIISHPNNLISSSNTNVSYSNLNNFLLSGEYQNYQEQQMEEANKSANQMSMTMSANDNTQSGFYSPRNQQLSPDYTSNNFRQTNLLSPNLVNSLKDQYYKTKGYIENKPDILMDFVMDYKNFVKRGLKVPNKIQPFMEFHEEDIYYSLSYYNNEFLMSQSKMRSPVGNFKNKFKIKFTQDTLKRLYPGLKTDTETQKSFENNVQNFDKFVAKLINQYYKTFKEYINDETKIYDFWLGLNEEEKDLNGFNWEGGEKNLELNLNNYFSNENIVKRLSKSFKRICGYECFHPRPLHDYWVKLITEEDKYLEGLYKYDSETLYRTLEEYYQQYKDQIKQAEEEKRLKESNLKSSTKNNCKKITKHKFEALKKRFAILAKPKDKWKTGRVMVNLKRQFKYDNIIQKMIKYEFENNRLFKFPEEYALYDSENMRKTIFKNSLEKKIKKESEEGVKKMLSQFVNEDEKVSKEEEKRLQEIIREDINLESFLKKMCIKYFHLTQRRLISDSNISINHFLSEMYASMLKLHLKATRRKFPKMKNYGAVKKSRFSNYPKSLKLYFFNLFRRIGINEKGKIIFANYDNMPFWAPSLSNKCKVHSNNCPPYCKNNSLNEVILNQKTKNFNTLFNLDKNQLEADERLNMWKRKDLIGQKSKIFLCLNEAEHCTFEPKINKKPDEINQYTKDDLVNKRISNKVWVNKMGENFSNRFPLVFKEGVVKRVNTLLNEGKFSEVLKELEDAFDLDGIRCHFDKNYEKTFNKKKEENKMKNTNETKNDVLSLFNQGEGKKIPEKDDFNNSKNLAICREVYNMLKIIDNYKKSKLKAANNLKKELNIVKSLSGMPSDLNTHTNLNNTNNNLNTYTNTYTNMSSTNNPSMLQNNQLQTNTIQNKEDLEKTKFIKDRYFKFFKTLMCPLKHECPYDIRPRWPHSDLKANTPFGQGCPYAHHISELKFEQEVKEKIRIKKKLLKDLEKDDDPVILHEWVPTGPLVPCNGCGKTFTDQSSSKGSGIRVGAAGGPKGLCGFCRYNQKNEIDLKKDKSCAEVTNKTILKKINYGEKNVEEWDQDYINNFGMLKKAAVLYSFKRYTDSLKILEHLNTLVKEEQLKNDEKFISLDKKWRAKLGITCEIPKDVLNYNINSDIIDHFKLNVQMSTLLLYVEKMRKGTCFSIFNRHTFLNNQIIEFYEIVKKKINGYKTDFKKIKSQLDEYSLWGQKKEKLKTENPKLYKKFSNIYKAEMCPNLVKTGKCPDSYRNCKFAHNSNQLNLTLVNKKVKLLNNTLNETKKKIKQSKSIEGWKYPKQNLYEKGPRFDKRRLMRSQIRNIRSKSEARAKSIDIKKMKIYYHEL